MAWGWTFDEELGEVVGLESVSVHPLVIFHRVRAQRTWNILASMEWKKTLSNVS